MELRIYLTKGRFTKALGLLFILAALALVFFAGGYLGQITFEPQVVVNHDVRTIYRDIERIEYRTVEKVIERVVYEPVERVIVKRIERPRPLRHFQNLEELEQWLGNIGVIDVRFNVVDSETGQYIKKFDCDDYAMRLQEKSLRDGYVMSFEVISPAEYNALFKQKRIPADDTHAINLVIIGNEIYYIEPQNHEIIFKANLD